jgi:hypothetical protein
LNERVTRTIDYVPLLTQLSPAEVKAYRAAAKARGESWARLSATQVLSIVIAIPAVSIVVFSVGSAFATFAAGAVGPDRPIIPLLFIGFAVLIVSILVTQIVRAARGGSHWQRWARLDAFARANRLTFSPRDAAPVYPGSVFGLGDNRVVSDRLTDHLGRYLDLGNYRYTTGSGKNRTTHDWGFLALKLDRRLPHMLLDARSNNSIFGTNLPSTFDRDQILKLEGDFNEHFTLYCPAEYERDALYVFTPDLMALLIDEAGTYDVEIVDDWMLVYAAEPFRMGDATTVQRLFRIADTVGQKTVSQTDRYADERIGDRAVNLVAPGGTRLKKGVPVAAIVFFVIFGAFWAWGFFGDLLP